MEWEELDDIEKEFINTVNSESAIYPSRKDVEIECVKMYQWETYDKEKATGLWKDWVSNSALPYYEKNNYLFSNALEIWEFFQDLGDENPIDRVARFLEEYWYDEILVNGGMELEYMATTTYTKLKSGGTGSAWFKTNKKEIDPDLIQEFYTKFPDFVEIHNLSISSVEKKNGVSRYYKHYNI
jgi:hypothetical protein